MTVEQWLEAALAAMAEVATGSLMCDELGVRSVNGHPPASAAGAYIPLIAGNQSLQLGVISSAEGCTGLTRALFGMEPDEESPPQEDVADAVGEIVNIAAGVLQRQLGGNGEIELGLPIFIHGAVAASDKLETAVANVEFGEIEATVVLLRGITS